MEGQFFIVSRKRPDLLEYLACEVFAHQNVQLILERRRRDRRQRSQAAQQERRRGARRIAWSARPRGADLPDSLGDTRPLYPLSD